jgi:glycerol-3-phosphate responsive antiterminator
VAEPETGELVKPEDGELRAQREYVIKTKKERFQEMCRLLRIDAESLKNNLRKIE